jgi:hypothetical protein
MQRIFYNVKVPNYLDQFETYHNRLRINECCKISTNYAIHHHHHHVPEGLDLFPVP